MMKTYLYLTTAIISVSLATSGNAWAQCVSTQDCTALGYTETSCPNGNGVKCPFGNKWFCGGVAEKECSDLGYPFTCTGTEYAGGSGAACADKYYQTCSCADGYNWKNNACQEVVQNGPDGEVYRCEGKVIAVKTEYMDFYVQLDERSVAHAYVDNQYNVTLCGKKANLPTRNQFNVIYTNKPSLNALFKKYGGSEFAGGFYWSSEEDGSGWRYIFNMGNGSLNSSLESSYYSMYRLIIEP